MIPQASSTLRSSRSLPEALAASGRRSWWLELTRAAAPAQVAWRKVPASAWAALLYAGVVTSGMAHPGIAYAVGRCAAVVPSIYSCLQVPPVALPGLRAGPPLQIRCCWREHAPPVSACCSCSSFMLKGGLQTTSFSISESPLLTGTISWRNNFPKAPTPAATDCCPLRAAAAADGEPERRISGAAPGGEGLLRHGRHPGRGRLRHLRQTCRGPPSVHRPPPPPPLHPHPLRRATTLVAAQPASQIASLGALAH